MTQSFGIGIIYLDLDDVDASKVLYPAKSKEFLDWKTINKMCKTNPDFKSFIKDIKNDLNNEEIKKYNYDKINEDINEYIEKITKLKNK